MLLQNAEYTRNYRQRYSSLRQKTNIEPVNNIIRSDLPRNGGKLLHKSHRPCPVPIKRWSITQIPRITKIFTQIPTNQ